MLKKLVVKARRALVKSVSARTAGATGSNLLLLRLRTSVFGNTKYHQISEIPRPELQISTMPRSLNTIIGLLKAYS